MECFECMEIEILNSRYKISEIMPLAMATVSESREKSWRTKSADWKLDKQG